MRSLLLVLLVSGCSGAVIPQEPIIPSLEFPDASTVDAPQPVCYSGGHLYTETFVSGPTNTCRDQATQTVQVNMDGSIGMFNHCSTVVDGCKSSSTGCYSNERGTYCSIISTVTYSKDGSTGAGTMEMVCYPFTCNPEGICMPWVTSPDRCVGSYEVSLVRQ